MTTTTGNEHARSVTPPEPMSERRRWALALAALNDAASRAPDVREWAEAAAYYQARLAELRGGACPAWFVGGGRNRSRGRPRGG